MDYTYTINSLPAQIKMHKDESVSGLITKLSDAFSLESTKRIGELIDAPQARTKLDYSDWSKRMALLTSLDEDFLRQRAHIHWDDEHVNVLGVKFPRFATCLQQPRICPECLSEEGYRRISWELLPMKVCVKHQCKLLSHCPFCDGALSWTTPSLTTCKCGFDLRLAKGEKVLNKDLLAAKEVGIRLGLFAGKTTLSPPFAGLDLPDLLTAFGYLGRAALVRENGAILDKATLRREDSHAILSAGARVAAKWPGAFHKILDARCMKAQQENASSVTAMFGPIYKTMTKGGDTGIWPTIREAYVAYVNERPDLPIGFVGRGLARSCAVTWISMKEARAVLGVTRRQMERLKTKQAWRKIGTTGFGKTRRYHASDVNALAAKLSRQVCLEEMSRLLGMDRRRVHDLLKASPVELCLLPDLENARGYTIDPDEVFSFLNHLKDGAQKTPLKDGMDFRQVVSAASQKGIKLSVLLQLMNKGMLPAKGFDDTKAGFDALLFETCDVWDSFNSYFEEDKDTLSVAEAAEMLRVSEGEMSTLIRSQIVGETTFTKRLPQGYRVARKDIETFNRKYVMGRQLARELGFSKRPARWRTKDLSGMKLVAVIGPRDLDIYRRRREGRLPNLKSTHVEKMESANDNSHIDCRFAA
ncbi:TniQ family protein [Fodinicurvata halophila]|uniref:TniQ family protein n=1 Tax=Fodinicurvata halophila TaxID=1419723 RepID=A0ABV8UMV7_9PROT